MNSAAPAVRLQNVAKDYALDWRGRRVRALDGVSFTVAPGRICGLVGANGSGKSTTLKLCAGLVRASSGTCEVAGLAPADAVERGHVAYLPEETLLPDFDGAADFLQRLARVGGMDAPNAESAAERVLTQTGLAALARRPLATFSKGQRQRLGLAQALLREPTVLLLDEPASGLDPRAQAELRALLVAQRTEGRTVLLSAHFLPQLSELCDEFVVLDRGRVIFNGDRASVAARGGLERIYLEANPA
jgi:ABC-type multidrug transport system ATPase subunit